MPALLGLVVGFAVMACIWAVIGPFIALLNFIFGRFFIAATIMTVSLFCATFIFDDLVVTREEYKTLLLLGLFLDGVKWGIKWWRAYRSEPDELPNIVINVVDDEQPVMRDVTPRARQIQFR